MEIILSFWNPYLQVKYCVVTFLLKVKYSKTLPLGECILKLSIPKYTDPLALQTVAIGCRPSAKSSSPFEPQFGQDFMDPNRKGLDL